MLCDLLKHYLSKEGLEQRVIPLAVDVLTPDYYLYLYAGRDDWFVVAEADYLFVRDVPRDVEASFPVEIIGWRTRIDPERKTEQKLLSRNLFKSDRVDETDEDWGHYHDVIYQEYGQKYAVLLVRPKPGVGLEDFGLTFYDEVVRSDEESAGHG